MNTNVAARKTFVASRRLSGTSAGVAPASPKRTAHIALTQTDSLHLDMRLVSVAQQLERCLNRFCIDSLEPRNAIRPKPQVERGAVTVSDVRWFASIPQVGSSNELNCWLRHRRA